MAGSPVSFGALGVVEQEEDRQRDSGIDGGADELVKPEDVKVDVAEEAAIDEKDEKAVEEEEAEVDDNAGREVFDVDLNADAGGDVADDSLGHAVDADGLGGESVLKQTDGSSGESTGDGIAAGDGEEDGDDKRKIEDGQARKRSWEKSLQQ